MLPTIALRTQLGNLLATDTTTLDQSVNANLVILIMAPFVPNENLVPAGLTPATFTGSAAINVPFGAQEVATDPLTGQQIITLVAPVGGWRWTTGNTANLPQTIYGFALYTKALAAVLGSQLLPAPVPLVAAGQQIDLGSVTIRFNLQPMT